MPTPARAATAAIGARIGDEDLARGREVASLAAAWARRPLRPYHRTERSPDVPSPPQHDTERNASFRNQGDLMSKRGSLSP
jgi:hypothetical protein